MSGSLRVGFGFFRKTGPGSQKMEFIKSYDRYHTIIMIYFGFCVRTLTGLELDHTEFQQTISGREEHPDGTVSSLTQNRIPNINEVVSSLPQNSITPIQTIPSHLGVQPLTPLRCQPAPSLNNFLRSVIGHKNT
jgi:hypothetical protein